MLFRSVVPDAGALLVSMMVAPDGGASAAPAGMITIESSSAMVRNTAESRFQFRFIADHPFTNLFEGLCKSKNGVKDCLTACDALCSRFTTEVYHSFERISTIKFEKPQCILLDLSYKGPKEPEGPFRLFCVPLW